MDDSSNIVLVSSSNMARCATAAVAPTILKTIFTVACVAQGSTKCCRHEYCLEMERDEHIGNAYHNGFAGRFIQHMFVAGRGKPGSNGLEMVSMGKAHDSARALRKKAPRSCIRKTILLTTTWAFFGVLPPDCMQKLYSGCY